MRKLVQSSARPKRFLEALAGFRSFVHRPSSFGDAKEQVFHGYINLLIFGKYFNQKSVSLQVKVADNLICGGSESNPGSGSSKYIAMLSMSVLVYCVCLYREYRDAKDPFLKYFAKPYYQNNDPFLTYPAIPEQADPHNRRGRDDWFGYWEKKIRNEDYQNDFIPSTFSIEEIKAWVRGVSLNYAQDFKLPCYVAVGCFSLDSGYYPLFNGAVRQTAGEFGCGEARGRYLANPKEFVLDPTNGPSEQRLNLASASSRWVYRDKIDCLRDIKQSDEFNKIFDYDYGHLTPFAGQEAKAAEFLRANMPKVKLNVQRIMLDGAKGQSAIQVICAAPSLAHFDVEERENAKRTKEGFERLYNVSREALIPQYEAVASVAISEAIKNPNRIVRLLFTRVGGNMFGNPSGSIDEAIQSGYNLLRASGLKNIELWLMPIRAEEVEHTINLVKELSGNEPLVFEHEDLCNAKSIEEAKSLLSERLSVCPRTQMPGY